MVADDRDPDYYRSWVALTGNWVFRESQTGFGLAVVFEGIGVARIAQLARAQL